MEFFNASSLWNKSNSSLGVGGTSTELLLEELELDELGTPLEEDEALLLKLDDELALDTSLEVLSLVDVLATLEVTSLDEDESLLPLLLKIGFEQAVSTNNESNGNSFFILLIYIRPQMLSP